MDYRAGRRQNNYWFDKKTIKTMKTGRNLFIDYIRGIACKLIVLYHYTQRYNELFHNSENWKFRMSWGVYGSCHILYVKRILSGSKG